MGAAIRYLNGLGLVASGNRDIRPGKEFDKYFKSPLRSDPFLSYSGTSKETISFMEDIIKKTKTDTAQIAKVLKQANTPKTLKNIFGFVFGHIQYKPDKPTEEELRRPTRTWEDRATGVDCDCYSIFIGSILYNLGIPFALRMVKVFGKPHFQHVYVVVPKNGGQQGLENRNGYHVIDPVLDTFDEEHPFTEKYDLFMQPIRYLNGLNGLHEANMGTQLYYSPEAAKVPGNNVIFFDGVDHYSRVQGLNGLNGLNGLGFLRKVWGGIRKAGAVVKRISKKAIKPVVYKKGESGDRTVKRKLFNLRNRGQAQAYTGATAQPQQPLPPPSTSVSDTIELVKNLDKGMGVEQVLDLAKSVSPDNGMLQRIISAEARANKGISTEEARQIAQDTAKAESFDILNKIKQAGFGGANLSTLLMLGLLGGMVVMNMRNNRQQA